MDLGLANAAALVIASQLLVGWAKSIGVDGNDSYRLTDATAEHFGHPARGSARRNRSRRDITCVAAQLLHDWCQYQC
jgi:hypothetical protein